MKRFLTSIILVLITLISCNKSVEKSASKNVVEKKIVKKLTFKEQEKQYCLQGTDRANLDIKNNKLVYYKYYGIYESFIYINEFRKILSKNNIEFREGHFGCCSWTDKEGESCYAKTMLNEIKIRFGTKFIDSIKLVAEKEFVINNPNMKYDVSSCDYTKNYPNPKSVEDFWEKPTKKFNNSITYPKKYVKCKEEYDNLMDAEFILYKNGKIDSIKIETEFENTENNQFKKYFENIAIETIEKTKWTPLEKFGIKVNSRIKLTIDLK